MPYRYYNANPDLLLLEDCVCKAISTATGLKYDAVNNLLDITSSLYGCDKLCVCCYHRLLEDILCYRRVDCDFNETVKSISERYDNRVLIIRIDGHLTASVQGVNLDTWNASNKYVDCYWIVE